MTSVISKNQNLALISLLTEQNHAIQARLFNAADEPLGVAVQIRVGNWPFIWRRHRNPLADAEMVLLDTGLRLDELLSFDWTQARIEPANGARFGF